MATHDSDPTGPDRAAIPDRNGRDAVNVLIVDDSVVVRRVMVKCLGDDPRFRVKGAVANGALALDFVRSDPVEIVLLDMNMPGEDGLSVLAKLVAHDRDLHVVLLSATCREGSDVALQALALGAADVIAKPAAGHFSPAFIEHLRDRLLHLVPAAERARTPEMVDQTAARLRPLGATVRAVGIGASTGGIGAVTAVMAGFETRLPIPIFVTQHLPANFQPLFADQLRRATHLPVVIAEDGMDVRPGTVYVAPGRAHLSLERKPSGAIALRHSSEPCLHGGFPAVDPMFRALARIYGAGACGVLLSGMGRDGLAGAQAIVEAGGWMIAQDHGSSAVWGMPGSVVKAGLASAILPPGQIAHAILRQRQAAA
jgi:two-component system, chemotaxis family, protein-glutamate methylesterase/glutaminase